MASVARGDIVDCLRDLGSRVPDLIREADGPASVAVGSWTVGEVAAHLVSSAETYPRILRGEGSPRDSYTTIAQDNREAIAEVGTTTDLSQLADRFAAAAPKCVEALERSPAEVAWHGGLHLPAETVAAILAFEYALHGYDIAKRAGRDWVIERGCACTIFYGLAPLLPHYVDRDAAAGVDARIRVNLRGDARPSLMLHFQDGELNIFPSDDRSADCTIWADPWTWLLVSAGRQGPLWPALTARVLVWGRKPWVGLKLQTWLQSP